MHKPIGLITILTISLASSGCGSFFYTGQHPSVAYQSTVDHMPEEIRRSVRTVQVVPDKKRPELRVGGDYGQYIPTAGEGAAGGLVDGAKLSGAMLAKDPRSIFLMPFILPVALIAGGIGGAAAARIEKELAEFREGLTDDVVASSDRPLPSDVLADALVDQLGTMDDILSVTKGGDAILTVSITDISVNTENEDAVITTFANAELTSASDDSTLYVRSIKYAERDELRDWTANENAAWNDYAIRARQYLAAEVIADMFETVRVRHVLRPLKSETYTGGWSGRAKTHKPTFSWELFLLGGDPYESQIDEKNISFDLRVFEGGRLAYEARRINGTSHQVSEPLPRCKELRWSVRPVYEMDGQTRAGEWMRFRSGFDKFWNHDALEDRSAIPEFWQYFAEVSTRCSS